MTHAYSRMGKHEEAVATARQVIDSDSKYGGPGLLAVAYAYAGMRNEAFDAVAQLEHPSFWLMAQLHSLLGEVDETMRFLEEAYEARYPVLPWINVRGGYFQSMHGEPQFEDLLERMNLPG